MNSFLFFYKLSKEVHARTTDTQWRHKSKISEKLGRCGRENMLWPYLNIWEWEWIFGNTVKAISSLGIRSRWILVSTKCGWKGEQNFWKTVGVIYGQPKSSLQLISGSWSLLLVFCYGVYHLSNSTTPPLAALHISTLTFKTWLIFSRSGLVYTVSKFYDSALGNETGFLSLSLLSSSLIYTAYRFFNPAASLQEILLLIRVG